MHMSGPSRKKDENIFSDVYFIPLTVVLVHSTAYVQAHIINFLPVISLPAMKERKGCVCVCVCVCERESVSERGCVCIHVCIYLVIYNIKSVYVSMSEKSCRKRGRDFDMTRAMMLTAVWDISNNLQILTSLC